MVRISCYGDMFIPAVSIHNAARSAPPMAAHRPRREAGRDLTRLMDTGTAQIPGTEEERRLQISPSSSVCDHSCRALAAPPLPSGSAGLDRALSVDLVVSIKDWIPGKGDLCSKDWKKVKTATRAWKTKKGFRRLKKLRWLASIGAGGILKEFCLIKVGYWALKNSSD